MPKDLVRLTAPNPCCDTANALHGLWMIAGQQDTAFVTLADYRENYRFLFESPVWWN